MAIAIATGSGRSTRPKIQPGTPSVTTTVRKTSAGGQAASARTSSCWRTSGPPRRHRVMSPATAPAAAAAASSTPAGAEGIRDNPVAASQAERALPVGEPGLLRVRAEDVAEEQAAHGRGCDPGQPAPARTGQVAVREDDRDADHGDQHPRCFQSRPDGGQVSGAGDRARGGHHTMNAGLESSAAPAPITAAAVSSSQPTRFPGAARVTTAPTTATAPTARANDSVAAKTALPAWS